MTSYISSGIAVQVTSLGESSKARKSWDNHGGLQFLEISETQFHHISTQFGPNKPPGGQNTCNKTLGFSERFWLHFSALRPFWGAIGRPPWGAWP